MKEETWKADIYKRYFARFQYLPNEDNIDFVIVDHRTRRPWLWAESKKGVMKAATMLTQLLLTAKKPIGRGDTIPPRFLGCFDAQKMTLLGFSDFLELFSANDINWKATPSNHKSADFLKIQEKVERRLANSATRVEFDFADQNTLRRFIRANMESSGVPERIQIDRNNFVVVYNQWVEAVKPTIGFTWDKYKQKGTLDGDFYLADLLSAEGKTLMEKLRVLLENDHYRFTQKNADELWELRIHFTDRGAAHRTFWNRYQRPPKREYWDDIAGRRDLLTPRNVREIKGAYFTPKPWVEQAQEYLARALGENWQDEYDVWDCAAGTGNLLAGLLNPSRLWASTLDQQDVNIIHEDIDADNSVLFKDHVFQFDFLNGEFADLPPGLRDIVEDPERRGKLVVFINPPYAEATSATTITKTGANKALVATAHRTRDQYKAKIGKATNELFAQFMARIYGEIGGCVLAQFSKLKFVNSQNFKSLRGFFAAEFLGGFVVRADTFDNVKGKFPIGFTVWNLKGASFPGRIDLDVLEDGNTKSFWSESGLSINQWIKLYNRGRDGKTIGYMGNYAPDFQSSHFPFINITEGKHHIAYYGFGSENLLEGAIYFAARLVIEPTWLNDRDQFLFPNDGYKTDVEFQNDCLVYMLFHAQNRVSDREGVNHWIPFTEREVGVKTAPFDSHFMTDYITGKRPQSERSATGLFTGGAHPPITPSTPLAFSAEAADVMAKGRALWTYYHKQAAAHPDYAVNAAFYDIREYFQGRGESGSMNPKSDDEAYGVLIAALREAMKRLADKIQAGVYRYGFLRNSAKHVE